MIPVLVVDDEKFVREGIVQGTDWKSVGCEVVGQAKNGEEALALARTLHPLLIVTDIRMPKMDGIELVRTLREEKLDVKVIFLTEDLHILVRALEILNRLRVEKRYQYLPVFAAVLFGDPHRLDPGTRDAHLLQLLLQWLEIQRGVEADEMNSIPSLRRQARYLSAGILLDDVSNYAMLCGVEAIGRDGLVHAGMAGFAADGAPVNVPLSVITGWAQLRCRDNTLWIVENPVVYAVLCERFGRTRSLMCMNGQPRLSAWLILRLLRAAGTRVYYAGDFDPEGLCIAEKVQQSLLPGQCVFWHMSEADYCSAQSQKPIEARRMKMLDHLQDSLLKTTAVLIRKQGVAGYQENILQMYLSEENT